MTMIKLNTEEVKKCNDNSVFKNYVQLFLFWLLPRL